MFCDEYEGGADRIWEYAGSIELSNGPVILKSVSHALPDSSYVYTQQFPGPPLAYFLGYG